MKRIVLISTVLTLLLAVGCRKADDNDTMGDGNVKVTFAMSVVQSDASQTKAPASTTPLPNGSKIRATVYRTGEVTNPIVSELYVISGAAGKAIPVDLEKVVTLKAGTYDFYFNSPENATVADEIDVEVGIEALASGKQTVEVMPQADGKETVINVTLKRMHAMLDMVIVPLAEKSGVTSMSPRDKMSIYYLPRTGKLDVKEARITADATMDWIVNIAPSSFSQYPNPNFYTTLYNDNHQGAVVLPSTVADLRVDLPLKVNGMDKLYHVDIKDVTFEAGKYYTLKVEIGFTGECEGLIQEWKSQPQAPEMGNFTLDYTDQPANCYVVYPVDGNYPKLQFNALKRPVAKYVAGSSTIANSPCSNPAIATDPLLGYDIVYQTGDYLEVVWNSTSNYEGRYYFITPFKYSVPSDGVVTIKVEGTGNAVLAYKRSNGTILWNYHIWSTDTNPFVSHYATGSNVNGTAEGGSAAKFMDRNLGALSAAAMKPSTSRAYLFFGLLYQYGRPTPFTGQGESSTLNSYTQLFNYAGSAITINNVGGFTVKNETVNDITTAIQNPMNWYYYYFNNNNNRWYKIGEVGTWSDYGENKSVYDPCPYGYRVPKNGSWNGFTGAAWTTAIDGGLIRNGTWWPAGGYRWYDYDVKLTSAGSIGRYWSSSISGTNISFFFAISYDGGCSTSGQLHRTGGLSVRCVQEGY